MATTLRLFPGTDLEILANESIRDRVISRFPVTSIYTYSPRGALRPFLSKLSWLFRLSRKYDVVGITYRKNEQNALLPPSFLFPYFSGLTLFALLLRPKYILAVREDRTIVYSYKQVFDLVTGLDRWKTSWWSLRNKITRLSRQNIRLLITQTITTAVRKTWNRLSFLFLGTSASLYAVALTLLTVLAAMCSDAVRVLIPQRKTR